MKGCTLQDALKALRELGVKSVEARISGTDDSGSLEYMSAYGRRGEPIGLPPGLENCLEGIFYAILADHLEGSFNYPGGHGEVSLDLEGEALEASFYFYGDPENEEGLSLSLEEVAKEIGWKGPIPEELETETYLCYDTYSFEDWDPEPEEKETRQFLQKLGKYLRSLNGNDEITYVEVGEGRFTAFVQGDYPIEWVDEKTFPLSKLLLDEFVDQLL